MLYLLFVSKSKTAAVFNTFPAIVKEASFVPPQKAYEKASPTLGSVVVKVPTVVPEGWFSFMTEAERLILVGAAFSTTSLTVMVKVLSKCKDPLSVERTQML